MRKRISVFLLAMVLLLTSVSFSGCSLNDLFGIVLNTEPTHGSSEPTLESTEPTQESTAPSEETTEPTEESTEPTEESTEPTEESTEATEPPQPTTPTVHPDSGDPLFALENNKKGYGPGTAVNGVRPGAPQNYQNTYGKYSVAFIGPNDKRNYLTFDCGYEFTATDSTGTYRVTERILDVLKEKNVKATFFVTMWYVKSQPDLVRRMINEGHTVGNHSVNHISMPTLNIPKMESEILGLHNYMIEHFGYTMTLFRPPKGEYSTRTLAVTQRLGYTTMHWSFAYKDWATNEQWSYDDALSKIVGCHHNGAIWLLHAVSTTNAAVLGEVIDTLQAKGYVFVKYGEPLPDVEEDPEPSESTEPSEPTDRKSVV